MSIVGVALAASLGHKFVNYVDDCGNLAQEDYNKINRRALLSMLVHATYSRDLNCVEVGVAWLADCNNKRADRYRKLHWSSYPCSSASQTELKQLGVAFLRRKRSHNNPNAPGLAIVLRGTIPSKRKDLIACLKLGCQRLNESDRVRRIVSLVSEVVKKFRKKNPRGEICMAGHSLGAAVALIVGGILHSESATVDIDTHLFNPPLMTLMDVLTGKVNPPANSDGVRHGGATSAWLKERFVDFFGDRAAMDAEWAQFQKRRQWIPTFYLNPWDFFCLRGRQFFKTPVVHPGDVISWQGVLSKLFYRDARYFRNFVPSAHVYISNWKEGNRALAHALRQWHKYNPKHIKLEYHRIDLLCRRGDGQAA